MIPPLSTSTAIENCGAEHLCASIALVRLASLLLASHEPHFVLPVYPGFFSLARPRCLPFSSPPWPAYLLLGSNDRPVQLIGVSLARRRASSALHVPDLVGERCHPRLPHSAAMRGRTFTADRYATYDRRTPRSMWRRAPAEGGRGEGRCAELEALCAGHDPGNTRKDKQKRPNCGKIPFELMYPASGTGITAAL